MKANIRILGTDVAKGFSLIALLSLAGCDMGNKVSEQPEVPVGFGIAETKASPVANADLTSMGVFGYYTAGQPWDTAFTEAVPNYFDNTLVAKTAGVSGGWSYSPLKYWPEATTDKITFFAYSPHSSAAAGVVASVSSDASSSGAPSLFCRIPAQVDRQIDLLYADPLKDKSRTTGPLLLAMNHALTQISFSASFAAGESGKGYMAEVSEITFSNIVAAGTLDLGTGDWCLDDTETPVNYVLSVDGGTLNGIVLDARESSSFSPQRLTAPGAYLMLLPQRLGDEAGVSITFTTYKPADPASRQTQVLSAKLSNTVIDTWQAGKSINYLIEIQGDYISTTTTLTPWVDKSSSGNVFVP